MFTDVEYYFLDSLRHGRLVSIGPDDSPQVHPVPFIVDRDSGSIEVGGARLRETHKYKNVRRDPRVSLIVDDPYRPSRLLDEREGRSAEIHGFAELDVRSGADIIRIRPVRVDCWNLDGLGHSSRFVP